MAEDDPINGDQPRRSARLALAEIVFNEVDDEESPNRSVSADEMIIVQRGPRRRPVTWSPVDMSRTPTGPLPISPKELRSGSAESIRKRHISLNPKLRRRLILSPTKGSLELGNTIAKKLRSLPKFDLTYSRISS